jgi:hypothetical protein
VGAAIGSRVHILLRLDSGPLEVTGDVARSERTADGTVELGVRFDELAQDKQDVILRWCFSQPFGPDFPIQGVGAPVEADQAGVARAAVAFGS